MHVQFQSCTVFTPNHGCQHGMRYAIMITLIHTEAQLITAGIRSNFLINTIPKSGCTVRESRISRSRGAHVRFGKEKAPPFAPHVLGVRARNAGNVHRGGVGVWGGGGGRMGLCAVGRRRLLRAAHFLSLALGFSCGARRAAAPRSTRAWAGRRRRSASPWLRGGGARCSASWPRRSRPLP